MNKSKILQLAIKQIKTAPSEIFFSSNSKSFDMSFPTSECSRIKVDKHIIFLFSKEGISFPFSKTKDHAKKMIEEFGIYKLEDIFSLELNSEINKVETKLF